MTDLKTQIRSISEGPDWPAFGLVLLSCSRLRNFSSLALGPGEAVLLAWTVSSFFSRNLRREGHFSPGGRSLLLFWGFSLCGIGASTLWALRTGKLGASGLHDGLALIFCALFCLALVWDRPAGWMAALAERYAQMLLFFSSACLLLGAAFPTEFSVWYEGTRFEGLSNNPNQMALYLLPLPFLFLLRADQSQGGGKMFGWIQVAISLGLGIATGSDALRLAWLAGLFTGALKISLAKWTHLKSRGHIVIALLALAIASGLFGLYADHSFRSRTGHGEVRVRLWENGLFAWSESPWYGHGVGVYSGLIAPFGPSESHNLFIDWMNCGGVVGLLALTALFTAALGGVLRHENDWFTGLFVSLTVMCVFYFTARQPVFWFMLYLMLSAPRAEGRAPEPVRPKPNLCPS